MRNYDEADYKKLSSVLKRHNLKTKLQLAEKYSRMIMNPEVHSDPSKLSRHILPWDLECFVLLSVKATEWKSDQLDENHFIQIMNCIRDAYHPKLQKKEGSPQFTRWLMMALSATQFDYLESYWHKLYRYTYYFSFINEKINMPDTFQKTFGIDYQSVMTFSLSLWLVYIAKVADVSSCKKELLEKFPKEAALLTISREDFIEELDRIASDPMDYIYCLRPSYSFPFVRDNEEIYLPLPHLLLRASTASLMFRLTNENDKLREMIGLEVLESYLVNILSSYPEFERVEREIVYSNGKLQNQRSADVMTYIADQIICFDSKSFVPKISLRVFSEAAYSAELIRLGKAVKQMYEQIHDKYGIEYNPFNVEVDSRRSNIWGIIVVSENPFINLKDIYAEAARQLKGNLSEEEFEWLQGHVGIVSLSALEHQVFSSDDILSVIRQNIQSKRYNDQWFASVKTKSESKALKEFKDTQAELATKALLSLSCVVADR